VVVAEAGAWLSLAINFGNALSLTHPIIFGNIHIISVKLCLTKVLIGICLNIQVNSYPIADSHTVSNTSKCLEI
jgi:hypothetical protein